MWISSKPRAGIKVDEQPIELVAEFCCLGYMLKNNGSYEKYIQQRCAKSTSAFNSLTKCLWANPNTNEVKLRLGNQGGRYPQIANFMTDTHRHIMAM
ncbi:hypothetical protein RB195_000980 [Necator americanus]|uniref:Uncharacterized protein n=1 Tax=Necator americanus TaxID=51031 RepID=A0ABR1DD18_NECAM